MNNTTSIISLIFYGLMVFSAVMLTYRWFSIVHGDVDPYIILFSFLLMFSLGILFIINLFIIKRNIEEISGLRRVLAISSREIENRVERVISDRVRYLERELDEIRRRIYR